MGVKVRRSNGRVIADVTLVRSNFFHFLGVRVRATLKLGRKTVSEHRRVIYLSNWKESL